MGKVQVILETPTELDWARLAAYIDGEGSIQIARRAKSSRRKTLTKADMHIYVNICQVDVRLTKWLKDTFGGVCVYEAKEWKKENHRPIWRWAVTCRRASWVLENCLPYFILKRDQAEIALTFQGTLGYRGRFNPVPSQVAQQREELRTELQRLKTLAYGPDMQPIN